MKRFKALDVFRGLTVCLMIIVNTPGDWSSTFSPLLHAKWHGFTPTDLVFPSFLFAVGNAFAFVKTKWGEKPFSEVFKKIAKRTLLIFLLGYTMYWIPFFSWTETGELTPIPFSETRILGVLQRIALCYFIGAVMIYFLTNRQLIIASVLLLLSYWGLLSAFGDYTLEGNFARTVDRLILGDSHLYMGNGIPFDPEGLLSTLPSIGNVLAGYLIGKYIIDGGMNYEKLAKMLLMGAGLLVVAYLWDLGFPVNKKLWTSSFVTLTVGLDIVVLSVLIYTIDFVKKPVNYNFFEVFGKNPLFIYLLSEYVAIGALFIRVNGEQSLYNYVYEKGFSWIGPYFGSLAFALVFMLFCWSIGFWLDKKKIYIKV
ncbi:acyltransferase family protein [Zobellia sp. 1_MG-2023]|uniref:acyltransferase family protein n=1 Tax=Zobellia sp. 1_MG-2023 TaxID=3062626 RepID=UPI0026E3360A|nr:heparan-alpha-glucosaminide N-acetyltransferase domain-containing protein [Zobellia sp. 1_MG-2023]MDO6817736.1 heparan-alpha-glucosaminide N-acetyltransferase domain-containing protein [Zobellia sp. 1_MG-2023]